MLELDDILGFVQAQTGYHKPVSESADLDREIGVFGDDMQDLLEAYAERFDVDMTSYLWYFHTGEEGVNLGGLFFKPPYCRVKRIPVTLAVLLRSARTGVWSVDYPYHFLPSRRLDMLVNQVITAIVFAVILWKYVLR